MAVNTVPVKWYKEAHCIVANEPRLSDKTIQDAIAMFEARRASNSHMGTDFPCNCELVDETLNPQTPETGENHG